MTFSNATGQDVGVLTIRVSRPVAQEATASCAHTNSGTGYLATLRAATAACVTAAISDPAAAYLEDGDLPKGKWCRDAPADPTAVTGATVDISGPWVGKHIKRQLTVRSPCEAAMWSYLAPLIHAADEPLIVHESH